MCESVARIGSLSVWEWVGARVSPIVLAVSIALSGCSSKEESKAVGDKPPAESAVATSPPKESAPVVQPVPTAEAEKPSASKAIPSSALELLSDVDAGGYESSECVAVAPDGKTLYVGGRSLAAWEIGGKEAAQDLGKAVEDFDFDDKVVSIALSPGGNRLAMGCSDGTVRIWDVANGTLVARVDAHKDGATDVAFGPEGRVASYGRDGKIRIWNSADGKEIDSIDASDPRQYSVVYSPDGKRIASCGEKATIWDAQTKQKIHSVRGSEDFGFVQDVAFSPDGSTLACGEIGWSVTLWDVETGKQREKLTGHQGPVRVVSFRPDGAQLASAGDEYTVRIFDVASGKLLQTISTETERGTETPTAIAWTPDGQRLVVTTTEGRIYVWGPKGESLSPQPSSAEPAPTAPTEPKPTETAVAPPSFGDGPPAHVFEAARVIDLSKLPWPEGTDGANDDVTQLHYDGPGDVEAARKFYHDHLTSAGWKDVSREMMVVESSMYEKDGFRLYVSVTKSYQDETGVTIQLMNYGNFDVRRLPKPKQVDELSLESAIHGSFFSSARVKDLAEFYNKELAAQGWRPTREIAGDDDVRSDWIWNGVQLVLSIGAAPAKGGMTHVQYYPNMARGELPIPPDSSIEEYEDYPGMRVKLTAKGDVRSTAEFLEKEMRAQGWEPSGTPQLTDTSGSMNFKQQRQTAEIKLASIDVGGTSVAMSTSSTPSKELLAFAGRAAKREKERQEKAKQIAKDALKVAIPIPDFPLPEGAYDIERSKFTKNIQCRYKGTVAESLKFFRDTLSDWKEKQDETMEQDEFGQIVLQKEIASISIRVIKADEPGVYRFYIEGTGLRMEGE